MKRITALILICLLLLGGCGAPAEEEFTPNDSPLISAPNTEDEPTEEQPDAPSTEQEQSPSVDTPVEDEPVEEKPDAPSTEPEQTPTVDTPSSETPDKEPEEDEERPDWTTSCMTFKRFVCVCLLDCLAGSYFVDPADRAFDDIIFILQPSEKAGKYASDVVYVAFAAPRLLLIV